MLPCAISPPYKPFPHFSTCSHSNLRLRKFFSLELLEFFRIGQMQLLKFPTVPFPAAETFLKANKSQVNSRCYSTMNCNGLMWPKQKSSSRAIFCVLEFRLFFCDKKWVTNTSPIDTPPYFH